DRLSVHRESISYSVSGTNALKEVGYAPRRKAHEPASWRVSDGTGSPADSQARGEAYRSPSPLAYLQPGYPSPFCPDPVRRDADRSRPLQVLYRSERDRYPPATGPASISAASFYRSRSGQSARFYRR